MEEKIGWSIGVLADFGRVVSGGTPSTKNSKYWGGDIAWVSPKDLSGYAKKYISKGKKSITKSGLTNSSAKLMPAGSVLFSSRAPIGYMAIAANDICTNQGFKSLIPNDGVESEFIYYFFKSIKQLAERHGSGTTFNELSASAFAQLPIEIPPLPEQRSIVAKIERLFSDLDDGIANLEKAREQLKIYRQAVLKKAFEGGFTGGINGWKNLLVDNVFKLIDGDRGPNYPKQSDYLEKGHCLFLSTKNVRPDGFKFKKQVFISEKKHNQLRKGTLTRGDIILTTRGTLGNIALYDENVPFAVLRINSGMLILRLKINNISKNFLINLIQSPKFTLQIKKSQSGTAQPQLPAGTIKFFELLIPPLEIQQRVVQEIETRLSVCDNVEANIEEALRKAEALRQSILKKAFEGKLLDDQELAEVRGAPDWESAEKLLEKIKAEKATK